MKNRFYVYASWEEQMSLLSTEEQATMLMNLFRYQNGEELVLDTPMLKMCWASMTFLLEKDNQAYKDSVERAKKATAAKKQRNQQIQSAPHDTATAPNGTATAPNDTNGTTRHRIDNVNVNDNVNDNVDVNENGDEIQSVNVDTSTNGTSGAPIVYPSPNSTEFELLTKEERTKAMDLYFSL